MDDDSSRRHGFATERGSAPEHDKPGPTPRPPIIEQGHLIFVDRTLRKCGVYGEDARDIRQDVLLLAHRHLRYFRGDSSFETWLFRICIREVARFFRTKERHVDRPGLNEIGGTPTPLYELLAREREARFKNAFVKIGGSKRRAFELYALEGMSMKEVAAVLGCPMQTAYSRVRAAKAELSLLLEHEVSATAL